MASVERASCSTRRIDERAGDRHHLLLAAGERARLLPLALAQHREERVDALEVGRDAVAVVAQIRPELELLQHAELGEEAAPLGAVADALGDDPVSRKGREVGAAE